MMSQLNHTCLDISLGKKAKKFKITHYDKYEDANIIEFRLVYDIINLKALWILFNKTDGELSSDFVILNPKSKTIRECLTPFETLHSPFLDENIDLGLLSIIEAHLGGEM